MWNDVSFPVAAALLDWGMAEGATNFSHVFQPLGAIGVRHGCTGQLHNQLFTFGSDGKPEYKFKANELLRGETDGSSYPNGGLRSKWTRSARVHALPNCLHSSQGCLDLACDGMLSEPRGVECQLSCAAGGCARRCGDKGGGAAMTRARVLTWCRDVASSHPHCWRVHDPRSHLAHLDARRHHLCPDVSFVRACAWLLECALACKGAGTAEQGERG